MKILTFFIGRFGDKVSDKVCVVEWVIMLWFKERVNDGRDVFVCLISHNFSQLFSFESKGFSEIQKYVVHLSTIDWVYNIY